MRSPRQFEHSSHSGDARENRYVGWGANPNFGTPMITMLGFAPATDFSLLNLRTRTR